MITKLLLGKTVSSSIRNQLSLRIQNLKKKGIVPGLAAVLVGDNAASHVYVRNKSKFFSKNNCLSETFILPDITSENELLELISKLNNDETFHGILIQLPSVIRSAH